MTWLLSWKLRTEHIGAMTFRQFIQLPERAVASVKHLRLLPSLRRRTLNNAPNKVLNYKQVYMSKWWVACLRVEVGGEGWREQKKEDTEMGDGTRGLTRNRQVVKMPVGE